MAAAELAQESSAAFMMVSLKSVSAGAAGVQSERPALVTVESR